MAFNKFIFPLCLLLALIACGEIKTYKQIKDPFIPKPVGFVNDFERIYTPEEVSTLDSLLVDFEKRTTIQIVILTIDTSMTEKKDFDEWTHKIANIWGVGQKDKNTGVLIGISGAYRRIRIENGAGISKILSDSATKEIIDKSFIPYFMKSKYYEGTLAGLKALMEKLE